MEDRETARMRKYGESKRTRIMMATVPHVTSGLELRKFQADGFLLTRVYFQRISQEKKNPGEGKNVLVDPTKGCRKVEVYVPSF